MSCPICYEDYNEINLKIGKCDYEDFKGACSHYCCKTCITTIYKRILKSWKKGNRNYTTEVYCPLCRDNWTLWVLIVNYDEDDTEEDTEDEDDNDETLSN